MRMHLLSGGRLSMPRAVYYPDARPEDWFEMPVSCALFHHAQGVALFDTGCHPDAADDGENRWGRSAARYSKSIFRREDAVVGQLPNVGLTAQDVDLVICSHLHYDHCGCNAFFDRATVICQARELTAARAEDAERQGFLRREWDVGTAIQAIDGEHDVFGDGRLTLIPLPGHTPGSMGAHAVLGEPEFARLRMEIVARPFREVARRREDDPMKLRPVFRGDGVEVSYELRRADFLFALALNEPQPIRRRLGLRLVSVFIVGGRGLRPDHFEPARVEAVVAPRAAGSLKHSPRPEVIGELAD